MAAVLKPAASNSTDQAPHAADIPPTPNTSGEEIAIAYGDRDITRSFLQPDGTFYNDDTILQLTLGGDLRAYEDLLRDDQVQTTFEQRRSAVTSAQWSVKPGADDAKSKAAADLVEQNLKQIGWDTTTDKMLYTRFFGWGVAEIIWTVRDGQFVWDKIKVRDRKRFLFQADGRCFLNTPRNNRLNRIYAEAPYFWVMNAGGHHSDMYYGLGLAHSLFWPVRFKRDGIRFWLVYLEKFGMPTAVGSFKPGATPDARAKLLAAVKAIQTQAGVIIPEDMIIKLLEATRAGTGDYKMLASYMDAAISKICVGQTLTTEVGSSGGNRALGQVHHGVRQDIIKSDVDLVNESFNAGPVRWLVDYNFDGAKYPLVTRETEEATDLTALAAQFVQLESIGFKPTLSMIQDYWGADFEESEAPDPAMLPPAVLFPKRPGTGNLDPKTQRAANDANFAAAVGRLFPDQEHLDESLDLFEKRIATLSKSMLDGVLDYAGSHSPAEMLQSLRKGLPRHDDEALVEALTRVIFVAKTWGRHSGVFR